MSYSLIRHLIKALDRTGRVPTDDSGWHLRLDPTFLPGHAASIHVRLAGKEHVIGHFGILHPTVLEKFELKYPVSTLEIDIEVFMWIIRRLILDSFAYRALPFCVHVSDIRDDSDDGLTGNSKSRIHWIFQWGQDGLERVPEYAWIDLQHLRSWLLDDRLSGCWPLNTSLLAFVMTVWHS